MNRIAQIRPTETRKRISDESGSGDSVITIRIAKRYSRGVTMKAILSLTMLLMFVNILPGAIHEYYSFSQGTAEYTPIQGTLLPALSADDALSGAINIGFTFPYGTVNYTQVKISSNGWVGLGTAASAPQVMNELVGYWVNWSTIAPLWDDISLVGGSCQYITEGATPNRVFKVQYTGARWIYFADNQFSFQVWLHESGNIEFIYGSSVDLPLSPSASIGINMLPHDAENFLSVTPGNPATSSYLIEDNLVSAFPGNGVQYLFSVVPTINNDLAAISVSGNQTPTQGIESQYVVTIQNLGSSSQSVYEVQLKTGTEILASVPGTPIASEASMEISVPYTPAQSGPLTIYGSVALANDELPDNNNTPPINLTIQQQGTITITVGSGLDLDNIPIHLGVSNSLYETVYYASELNIAGAITGISLYNDFVTNLTNQSVSIWLSNTDQQDLTNDWIPASELDLVFSGMVDFPQGLNTIPIQFSSPFTYTGGNLVMMISRPWNNITYNELNRFRCQSDDNARARFAFSDIDVLLPTQPPDDEDTITEVFPYTSFSFEPVGPEPQISISPSSLEFGTLMINTSQSQAVRAFNMGAVALIITGITISGNPYFTLPNLPVFPYGISSLQSLEINCTYSPLADGTHNTTVYITDSLNRTIYSVQVIGTCVDTNINTLPNLEDFDAAMPPALPLNWSSLIVPEGLGAFVAIESGGAHSEPNYASLGNHLTTTASVFLISPQLSPSIVLSALRVKFFARGFFTNSSIVVGIMDNPADPLSFIEINNFRVFSNWDEYIVSLHTYSGQGRYIAFKHGNGENFEAIHIDDITVEVTPVTDLAALSVNGSVTPTLGLPSDYVVNVHNYGTGAVSGYTVSLYKNPNQEIASSQGTFLAAGNSADVVLTWTPDAEGPTIIYGKIAFDEDENNLNDQTPDFHILVHPAGSLVVTIGSGDETASIPVNLQYQNSLFETIYLSGELNFAGLITAMSLYNTFDTGLEDVSLNVWMGSTQLDNLEENWISSSELQHVFVGTVDFPVGENLVTITLDDAFTYEAAEGNLVVMVERPLGPQAYISDNYFYSQTSAINRSRHAWSNQIDLDPVTPPPYDMNLSGLFPKTSFSVTPLGLGQLTGTVYSTDNTPLANASVVIPGVGETQTNTQGDYEFENLLGIIYLITASRNGYYPQDASVTVVEDSTLTHDFYLQQMPSVTVSGLVVGSDEPEVGIADAVVTLSEYENYSVNTDALGYFTIPGVYVDQSYLCTISHPRYQPFSGTIEVGSTAYDLGATTLTEQAASPSDVLASLSLTPYSANLTWLAPYTGVNLQPGSVSIMSNTPRKAVNTVPDRSLLGYKVFRLLEGQEQSTQYWVLLTPVLTQELFLADYAIATLQTAMYRWAVQAVYTNDLYSPVVFSNAVLHLHQSSGIISGVVRTSATQPVAGASISAGVFFTTTLANGYYSLPVTTGTYSVSCSALGYELVTIENIAVQQDQTTVCNFAMTVENDDEVSLYPTQLLGNFPNPFNPHTTIHFSIKDRQQVRIDVFNSRGQFVRALLEQALESGPHTACWDGKDSLGNHVSSGLYYYRMSCAGYNATRRMMLLK